MLLQDDKKREDLWKNAGPSEKQKRLSSQAQLSVKAAVFLSYSLALILIAAVVLSFPFPFVRRIWMKEIWGYSGLVNALYFLLIANQLHYRRVSFAFAGLGLLFFDQIRNWHGVWFLWNHAEVHFRVYAYLLLSFAVAAIFLFVFSLAVLRIYRYQIFKRDELRHYPAVSGRHRKAGLWAGFLITSAFYGCLYLAIQKAALMETRAAYGVLRILGGGACFFGFLAMGHAVDCFSRAEDSPKMTTLKILIHGIFLMGIQWMISCLLPLEALIQS